MGRRNWNSPVKDIDALMNGIDNHEENPGEVTETRKILKEITDAIGGRKGLHSLVLQERDSLTDCCIKLLQASSNARSILASLNQAVEEAKKIKIDFDIDSVNTLTALHEKFMDEEKKALNELSRERKDQIDQFRYDFSNALNQKGFWCSQKAFRWIVGITLLSIIIIAEITRGAGELQDEWYC